MKIGFASDHAGYEMKKILLTISAVLLMATMANAQQKNIFGVRAGINFSSIGGDLSDSEVMTSFHVGASYQRLLTSSTPLYLETGLYISVKGDNSDRYFFTSQSPVDKNKPLGEYSLTDKVILMYLQVPVMLNYHVNLTEGLDFIPAAGLYAAYATEGNYTDLKAKKFDFGARFGIGVSYQKFYLGVNYDLGLANINGRDGFISDEDGSVKNRCWGISLGYNF